MTLLELQTQLGERMTNLCRKDLSGEELDKEIALSTSVAALGKTMVKNASVMAEIKRDVGRLSDEFASTIVG